MQAPKRLAKTASQIIANNNITLNSFNPGNIDDTMANNEISIAIYTSNSTCDIPGNEVSCALTSTAALDSFNPLSAVISGGKISFRMGTGNISAFAGNFSHYSAKQDDWQVLMGQNNCTRTASELNASRPCYIDTTNNKIWIRLPHFSGTSPQVTGGIVTASSSSSS